VAEVNKNYGYGDAIIMGSVVVAFQKLKYSIRTKVGFAFAVILLCFITNGIFSVMAFINVKIAQEQVQTTALQLERLQLYDLAYNSQLQIYSDIIFITKVSFVRDTFKNTIINTLLQEPTDTNGNATRNFSVINVSNNNNNNFEFVKQFSQKFGVIVPYLNELDSLIIAGNAEEAKLKWREYNPKFEELKALIIQRRSELQAERNSVNAQLDNILLLALVSLISLTLFSLVVAVFVLALFERVLVRPLRRLQKSLQEVARGNLAQNQEMELELAPLLRSPRSGVLKVLRRGIA
jgi:hypothetical protein